MRRAELVAGRWLGLALIVAGYAVLSGLLAIGVVRLVSGHLPPEPLVAVAFLAFQAVAVLTLALTLGTRLPSIAAGAVTVVLFGLGWFAGVLGNVAVAFDATALQGASEVLRVLLPTDGLWRGVIYGLEPPAILLLAAGRDTEVMAANPFFAEIPPPPAFIAWSVAWVVLVLGAGVALFRRREL
jgi:ABC-type transport system involved in multi-copper enzyme maturation permease subunit